jgi:polyferredoxin
MEQEQKKNWDTIVANWLGQFVAYSLIVFLLFLSWNWALAQIWPIIPEVSFLQMAGLWYLSSVLLKRD